MDGAARAGHRGRSARLLIARRLLAWFRRTNRSLPWRGTRDPYRIWVSEVMLQQTTVATVRARYDKFLERFPDLASLARAREESVLAAWSGLGYYARARNLRRAAQRMVRDHHGRVPQRPEQLLSLPGFGPYMAAAVASLAYGVRAPAAEANVTRVLSRLFAISGLVGTPAHSKRILATAERLLPRRSPGDLTVALMDLGQTICKPRRPECSRCPVETLCRARRLKAVERYPRCRRKPRVVSVAVAAAAICRGGRALLVRRKGNLLAGMWQFPSAEGETAEEARRNLSLTVRQAGFSLSRKPVGHTRHTIVNRRLAISVYPVSDDSPLPIRDSRLPSSRFFRVQDLERAATPTLTRKIARAAGFVGATPDSPGPRTG